MASLFSRSAVIVPIVLANVCVAFFSTYPPISLANSIERLALQLKGPRCASQHSNILTALSPLPGVRAIDVSSVPDHALIDIDTEILSVANVVEKVRKLWVDEATCHVEPMQSCISAGPPLPANNDSMAH